MKVQEMADVEVGCEAGSSGNDPQFHFVLVGDRFHFDELYPHEQTMAAGLKPGQKRTVHLVMSWEDDNG